jgi:alkanesulfonate monooxygenase SsuD/methylene tetrahydromethanopterin reductase-like flavin-dependent oxidoreductase (luciferase family)
MLYAVDVAPLGECADPRVAVRLARAAEAAGWDGFSTWDVLGASLGGDAGDPFVTLAAVAAATERLRLIASVVVLPRRRPQLVAQAAATLDLLSGGRLVLGIGAGADPAEFTAFGDSFDDRVARFDEGAAIVDRLLRGETVTHDGPAYPIADARVGPRPAQLPRPPIWVGAIRPGGIRRAARWDGWIAVATSEDGTALELSPAAFGSRVDLFRAERAALGRADAPAEIAVFAFSEPSESDLVAAYGAAGATWWIESLSPLRGDADVLQRRIEAGPPRP